MPRSKRHVLLVWLLLALVSLLAGGCSREVRYQVLTFFFTGVPPLDWVPPEETNPAQIALEARERRQLKSRRAQADRVFTGVYAHGPYVGEACAECHVMTVGGFGFRSGGSSETEKKTIAPGQFVLPPGELCVACHAGKGNAALQTAGRYAHGPGWNCLTCHEPHNSKEPYLLKAAANDLCQRCHGNSKGNAAAQAADLYSHGPGWNCVSCHDPHSSKEPALLTVAANDLCRQCHGDGFIHDADLHEGLVDCLDCHNPHMGRDATMLRDDLREAF